MEPQAHTPPPRPPRPMLAEIRTASSGRFSSDVLSALAELSSAISAPLTGHSLTSPQPTPTPKAMELYTKLSEDNECRGVPFHLMARNFGGLFRQRPDNIPFDERTALYDNSEPCEELDYFMSHSWRAAGWHKYLALVYFFTAKRAIGACVLAGLVGILLEDFVAKPPGVGIRVDGEWGVSMEVPVGVLLFSALAAFVTQFGPQLSGDHSTRRIFLDCACIHQTDEDLKAKGIKSLGGFLAASKAMILLWDETYFTRLWCVYEVACYRHLVPDGDVHVLPLRLAFLTFVLQATYFVTFTGFMLLYPFLPGVWGVSLAVVLNAVPMYALLAYFSDVYRKDQQALLNDLKTFDARNAECSVLSDRRAILSGIAGMYDGGVDAFNREVRMGLGEMTIAKLMRQRALVPYSETLLAIMPVLAWIINGQHMLWCRTVRSSFGLPPPTIVCEAGLAGGKGPPLPFNLCILIFHLNQVFAFLPWLSGTCMSLADTLSQHIERDRLRYLAVGLVGSFLLISHTLLFYTLGGAVASGTLGLPLVPQTASPWLGVSLELVLHLPFWYGTYSLYSKHQQVYLRARHPKHQGAHSYRMLRTSMRHMMRDMTARSFALLQAQGVLGKPRGKQKATSVVYSHSRKHL